MDYPGSPLRAGSDNAAAVRAVQQRLNALAVMAANGAEPLREDGLFGPSTEAAVRLFQVQAVDSRGVPLDPDGVVGPATWAALFRLAEPAQAAADNALLARVIAIAGKEVGVKEDPLGSNRGPRVDDYLRSCHIDPTRGSYAWCVAFLHFCFAAAAAGLKADNPLPCTAGVIDLWQRLGRAHRLRLAPRQACDRPELVRPGMVFFLDTGGGFGHAGLVVAVQGVTLHTIEGNTTDRTGSREGIGVFARTARTIPKVNLGFADPTAAA